MTAKAEQKHAIVTGADGFIGRYVTSVLHEAGYRVSALCRKSRAECFDGITSVSFDLANPRRTVESCGPADLLVHLAALLPKDGVDQAEMQALNATASGVIAETARQAGVRRVIYLSSIAVIGTPEITPIGVTHPLHPKSDYAKSKLEGEQICLANHPSVCVLRLSAPYGAGMNMSTVLPTFIAAAQAGERLHWLGDGTRRQDFIHAADVGASILAATSSSHHGPCMLGSGHSISMKELAKFVCDHFGAPPPAADPSQDPQEGLDWAVDSAEIRRLIGFSASIEFADAIRRMTSDPAPRWWRS